MLDELLQREIEGVFEDKPREGAVSTAHAKLRHVLAARTDDSHVHALRARRSGEVSWMLALRQLLILHYPRIDALLYLDEDAVLRWREEVQQEEREHVIAFIEYNFEPPVARLNIR